MKTEKEKYEAVTNAIVGLMVNIGEECDVLDSQKERLEKVVKEAIDKEDINSFGNYYALQLVIANRRKAAYFSEKLALILNDNIERVEYV